jgi:hypothetical protein
VLLQLQTSATSAIVPGLHSLHCIAATLVRCFLALFHCFLFQGFHTLAPQSSAIPLSRRSRVSTPQEFHHSRQRCKPYQRPRPPNLARQRYCSFRASILPPIGKQKPNLAQQFIARHSKQSADARILQRRHCQSAPFQNRRQPPRNPCAKRALSVKKQPPSRVPPLPVRKLRCQRNHFGRTDIPVCLPSFSANLSVLCVSALSFSLFFLMFFTSLHRYFVTSHPAFFPSRVKTLPLNFPTPFNAEVGIRNTSSNNPVIIVKNSSMLSRRSRVYGSP